MQSLAELRVCFAPGLRLHSFRFPEGFYRADEVPKWSLILWVGEGKLPPERFSQENESLLLRHQRGVTSVSWQVGNVGREMGFKPCQGMQCSWRQKAEPPCPGKWKFPPLFCQHCSAALCFFQTWRLPIQTAGQSENVGRMLFCKSSLGVFCISKSRKVSSIPAVSPRDECVDVSCVWW